MKEEEIREIEKLIQKNKYFFSAKIYRLRELLKTIKPQQGNFLFVDIIGRMVWSACATSKAIELLAKDEYDYGIKSLLRKLFEASLLIKHLCNSNSKEKIIAKIMADNFFNFYELKAEKNKTEALEIAKNIVLKFGDNPLILEYLQNFINEKKKHWHWTEMSFEKILRLNIEDLKGSEIYEMAYKTDISLLNSLHKNAHVDLQLEKDLLINLPNGEIEYKDPNIKSKVLLHAYLGLASMLLEDIIKTVNENLNSAE